MGIGRANPGRIILSKFVQDSLQQRYEGEHSARGMLLHTRALVRPIIKRLALLYSVFQQTISSCLDGERGVLFPQPRHSGSAAQAPNSRTSGGSPMAQSRVTQIVVDRLYQQLLEDDQVAGRCGLSILLNRVRLFYLSGCEMGKWGIRTTSLRLQLAGSRTFPVR